MSGFRCLAMLTAGIPTMFLAPAGRLDFIVDFAGQAGKSFILYTDAPATSSSTRSTI